MNTFSQIIGDPGTPERSDRPLLPHANVMLSNQDFKAFLLSASSDGEKKDGKTRFDLKQGALYTINVGSLPH